MKPSRRLCQLTLNCFKAPSWVRSCRDSPFSSRISSPKWQRRREGSLSDTVSGKEAAEQKHPTFLQPTVGGCSSPSVDGLNIDSHWSIATVSSTYDAEAQSLGAEEQWLMKAPTWHLLHCFSPQAASLPSPDPSSEQCCRSHRPACCCSGAEGLSLGSAVVWGCPAGTGSLSQTGKTCWMQCLRNRSDPVNS